MLACASCSGALGWPVAESLPVLVELPEFPAVWAAAEAWELSWVSSSGRGGPVSARPGATLCLELPRSGDAALLCRAVFGAYRSLPYGAVWPLDLSEDGRLRPGPGGGYAAALAGTLLGAGYRRCPFDLPRFAREAQARLGDPWDVDPQPLAAIVAKRAFRIDYLRAPGTQAVRISGLPLPLAPDSPWGSPAIPDGAGNLVLELVPGRVRRWMGGGYQLTVFWSRESGAIWTLSGPLSGLPDNKTLGVGPGF